MRPRCDRKRCTRKPPCIPIPRACLDSVRIPTPRPYFLPPLTRSRLFIPPPCFQHQCIKRPRCHCSDEDYCTTETCRSSSNCQNSRPQFCPYGPKQDGSEKNERVSQQEHLENVESLKENDVDNCARNINIDHQETVARKDAFHFKPTVSYSPSLTYESDTSTTSSQLVTNQPTVTTSSDVNAPCTQNSVPSSNNNIASKGLSEPINEQVLMKTPSTGTCNRSQFAEEPQTSHSPCSVRQQADAMTETDFPCSIQPTQNGLPYTGHDNTPYSGTSIAKQNEQKMNGSRVGLRSLKGRPYNDININHFPSNGKMVSSVKSTANTSCQTSFAEAEAMSSNLLHNVPSLENASQQNQYIEQGAYQSERLPPNQQSFSPVFKPPQDSYTDISSENTSIRRNAPSQQVCSDTKTRGRKSGILSPPKSLYNKNNNSSPQKISTENRLSPKDSLDVITAMKPHLAQRRNTSPSLGQINNRNTLSKQNYNQLDASLQTMPEEQHYNQNNTNSQFSNENIPIYIENDDNEITKQKSCRAKGVNLSQAEFRNLSSHPHEEQSKITNSTKPNMPVPNLTIINFPPAETINEKGLTRKSCCNNGSQTCESCAQADGVISSSEKKPSTSKLRRSQVTSMQLSPPTGSYANLDRGASVTSRISKKGSRNRRPWYAFDIESQLGRLRSKTSQNTCLCPEKSTDKLSCTKRIPCTREVGLSACASTTCVAKVQQGNQSSGCKCCYPPAFSQLSCAGNINGTCTCSDNTGPNKKF